MDTRRPEEFGNSVLSQHPPPSVIIALTASSLEEERAAVIDAGCDDYLRKPFRETELFELMSKHIGVRFLYEEKGQPLIVSRQSSLENVLTSEALAVLPVEWLTILTQGAEEADLEMLFEAIEHIRILDAPLADALEQLTNNFGYDEILALLALIRKQQEREAHTS